MNAQFIAIVLFVLNFKILVLAKDTTFGDEFFFKQLATNESLVVFQKEESLDSALSNTTNLSQITNSDPNLQLIPVQNIYTFTMCYNFDNQSEKMWSKRFNHHNMGLAIPSDFKIFDLYKNGDDFYILYKENADTFVQRISREEIGQHQTTSPAFLYADKPAFGKIGTSGKFYVREDTNICLMISCADKTIENWNYDGNQWHSSK